MNENVNLDLRIDDARWRRVGNCRQLVTRALCSALDAGGKSDVAVAVTVVLAQNQAVHALNRDWRNKDNATNILSFPAPKTEHDEHGADYLGDMILAYEVVAREAIEQGKPLATHLCHLVIHGTLHLLGHDHVEEADAVLMEKIETTAMQRLGFPDPYCDQDNTMAVDDAKIR